ncbi:MAG: DoxX family protein [Flavobacteriaceae bacterium]
MKTNKIIFYIATILFTGIMLFSISMYLTQTEMIREAFKGMGYPTYLVYPLAIAKILGLIVLWYPKFKTLKEWAYAGFFFNVVLAFFAHVMIGDGEQLFALLAFLFLGSSYGFYKKNLKQK